MSRDQPVTGMHVQLDAILPNQCILCDSIRSEVATLQHSIDSAVIFFPRGGSTQVVRYISRELQRRGHETRIMAGSLGQPGDFSYAATFYDKLDVRPYDYNDAWDAFERGDDAFGVSRPFHPSFEDRGITPDPVFSAVPPERVGRLERSWADHLRSNRSDTPVVHLHHLSHLQSAARMAYPGVPRITTLHGTELKFILAMQQRVALARRVGLSIDDLASALAADTADRQQMADKLAIGAGLDEADRDLLLSTRWSAWIYSSHWLTYFRHAAAQAGTVVTVSPHDRTIAADLFRIDDDIPVVANGVDMATFTPKSLTDTDRMNKLRHWLVTDPRGWALNRGPGSIRYEDADIERVRTPAGLRPIILWVGRFLEFKRVPILLRAFALARRRMDPPPVLLMWGGFPGELEGVHPLELARELGIENDTFFVGWRDHDDLVDAFNCADLLVAPSVNESFGLIYIEAMACGTPPIATATGGPLDLIDTSGDAANGWTVRPDDPTDLANTMCSALADPDEVLRRGRNGRTYAAREHSWSTVVDRYRQLYEEATSLTGL